MRETLRRLNNKRKEIIDTILQKENKTYFNKFIDSKERKANQLDKGSLNPWAFIRVSNEERTLEVSLETARKSFDRGVFVYNSCRDKSPEIIHDFCKQNDGFIFVEYPFDIIPAGSPLLNNGAKNIPYHNTLAAYYNFALSLIPKGDWICKIDADHFHFPDVFNFAFSIIKNNNDIIWFPRINCFIDYTTTPPTPYATGRCVGSDQWLVKNDDLYFENISYVDNDGYHAYETLRWRKPRIASSVECASIHFPFEKESRKNIVPGNLTRWKNYVNMLPEGFLDEKYYDEEAILSITKNFR